MSGMVRRWLEPPIFEGDEEKTRTFRMLNTILLGAILALAAYIIFRPELFLKNIAVSIADSIILVLLIGQLFILRRGRIYTSTVILLSMIWINLTFQTWYFGGVRDSSFTAYIIVILSAALLLNWHAGIIFLTLSILAGFGFAHAEMAGILTYSPDDPYSTWFDQSLNLVMATIVLSIAAANLNAAIKLARQKEQELGKSERKYRQAVENSPNPIFSVNQKGVVVTWNNACSASFQIKDNPVGQPIRTIFNMQSADREETPEMLMTQVFNRQQSFSGIEISFESNSGIHRTMISRLYPTLDQEDKVQSCVFANTDVTQRRQAEELLRLTHNELEMRVDERTTELVNANKALRAEISERKRAEQKTRSTLKEKEVLLQEIHHRVKNNLQVISSLLSLQSNYVTDKALSEILQDNRNRIRSMALIHEKLYRSDNLARINIADYLRELAEGLFRVQNTSPPEIYLAIETENVLLNIEKAVPCGLIVNELISNALKHAFPNGRNGEVQIKLVANQNGRVELLIADNGIGFSAKPDMAAGTTLGLYLVELLVNQLEGTIDLEYQGGTRFKINFPV